MSLGLRGKEEKEEKGRKEGRKKEERGKEKKGIEKKQKEKQQQQQKNLNLNNSIQLFRVHQPIILTTHLFFVSFFFV